jgi:transcriptional regulator with XRE-family HTH domain
MPMKKIAGEHIRLKRLELRHSLESLANEVGVSHSYIAKLEKGEVLNPKEEILVKIAQVLDVDEDALFNMFGKVPRSAKDTLSNNPLFAKAFSEIDSNLQLSEEKQEELKRRFIHWHKTLSKRE